MKEYVSKDILLIVIERNTLWNTNEAFEGLIKNIPTITKADIINDFCKWLTNQIVGIDNNKNQILVVRQDRWEDAASLYLAETRE